MRRPTRIRTIYRLPLGPSAPASARRIVARELSGLAIETVEDTCLLLSEIVTERLGYARPDPRLLIDVVESERHRWCVVDRGAPSLPEGLRATALDAFSDAWGVTRADGLTRTWFEVRDASVDHDERVMHSDNC